MKTNRQTRLAEHETRNTSHQSQVTSHDLGLTNHARSDRVGLGWRPELAAGIFAHFDQIDVVEVIADDYFDSAAEGAGYSWPFSRRQQNALRTLAAQVPVVLHGVSMGLASAAPVETKRLDAMARLVGRVRPAAWSEHLAFVRGGGLEIGHLAAPPRSDTTIEGAARNLERARAIIGARPEVENIATLVLPPGSAYSEAEWMARILEASGCGLLLDLHNLHANATNHGYDPIAFLDRLPAGRIRTIHLAGGKWIPAPDGGRRLLDDHLHDVPVEVFTLLEEVAARAPQPLTVILERDGAFPAMSTLLAQLDAARAALARGREKGKRKLENGNEKTDIAERSVALSSPHFPFSAFHFPGLSA